DTLQEVKALFKTAYSEASDLIKNEPKHARSMEPKSRDTFTGVSAEKLEQIKPREVERPNKVFKAIIIPLRPEITTTPHPKAKELKELGEELRNTAEKYTPK